MASSKQATTATITSTATKTASATATIKSKTENLYMQLNESELTAIIMKGSPNSNDRDAGFCSGSSEGGDDLSIDHARLEPSSPIDASDDSLEIKVTPIALVRNKRKSSEPSKVICEHRNETATALCVASNGNGNSNTTATTTTAATTTTSNSSTGPLKKRIRYTSSADSAVVLTPPTTIIPTPTPTPTSTPAPTPTPTPTPPQLWDPSQILPHELMPNPAQIFVRHPGVTTLHRMPLIDVEEQQEPLALVSKKRKSNEDCNEISTTITTTKINTPTITITTPTVKQQLSSGGDSSGVAVNGTLTKAKKFTQKKSAKISDECATAAAATNSNVNLLDSSQSNCLDDDACSVDILPPAIGSNRPQQRNYKNMTRERRIEANARERTRVHTISAAYETLRRAVPSYSNAQKLSKLSVLRVACSYILTLSRMAGHDYSIDQSEPSIASCFDAVTSTILTEGKIRKKKDE